MSPQPHAKHKTSLCPDDWVFSEKVYNHGAGIGLSRDEVEEQLAKLREYEFDRGYQFWDLCASRWLSRSVEMQAKRTMFPAAHRQSASERTAYTLRLVAKGGS